jgi:hypothetical protein
MAHESIQGRNKFSAARHPRCAHPGIKLRIDTPPESK